MELEQILAELETVLDELHGSQKRRAADLAKLYHPGITSEDLLNPDNFPELIGDPNFMYEDGTAAGVLAAKIALRAHFMRKLASDQ